VELELWNPFLSRGINWLSVVKELAIVLPTVVILECTEIYCRSLPLFNPESTGYQQWAADLIREDLAMLSKQIEIQVYVFTDFF